MEPWEPISKIQSVENPLGQTIQFLQQLSYKEKESKTEMEGEALGKET